MGRTDDSLGQAEQKEVGFPRNPVRKTAESIKKGGKCGLGSIYGQTAVGKH